MQTSHSAFAVLAAATFLAAASTFLAGVNHRPERVADLVPTRTSHFRSREI